jgi:hypothetical protein
VPFELLAAREGLFADIALVGLVTGMAPLVNYQITREPEVSSTKLAGVRFLASI